jgi:hypothetical protein
MVLALTKKDVDAKEKELEDLENEKDRKNDKKKKLDKNMKVRLEVLKLIIFF